MIKFVLVWMAIGALSRLVRGRGRWERYALCGPIYPLACFLVWWSSIRDAKR
jgi:hypothetical protein